MAEIFNGLLENGRFPPEYVQYRTTPLYKGAKPGQVSDIGSPGDYRFITIGNVIPKLFECVLAARITHWALEHHIIGTSQIGFLPNHSCEFHIFTLLESVRESWRCKHDAYILFVDLKKAYDAVHPSTLFAILRAMGLPPNLVNLLESRSNHRTTKVAVNGRSGDAIHMAEGVGQGDILSPILFALFIETLAVRLRKANLEGVVFPMTTPSGPKVSDLLYADDLAAVTQKAEELQTVADIVHGWCADYGMTANIGPSKTEAMHFPLPSNPGRGGRTDALPTLTYGGKGGPAISWVQSYRYLGCMLNTSLSADYALGHVAATLRKAYAKIFFNNNILRDAPPALAFEVFNTCVLASANNLMSLFPPNKAMEKAFDDIRNDVSRLVLWSGHTGPNASPVSLSRLAELNGIVAREHVRLSITLQQSPFRKTALACRVYTALRERSCPTKTPPNLVTWVHSTDRIINKSFSQLGVHKPTLPPPESHSSVSKTVAAVYGRAVGLATFQKRTLQKAAKASDTNPGTRPRTGPDIYDRPRPAPPYAFYLDNNAGLSTDPNSLGPYKGRTSLGKSGPGCSGSILSTAARSGLKEATSFISRLHFGRLALFHERLQPPPCVSFPTSLRDSQAGSAKDFKHRWHSAAGGHRDSPCPLCTSPFPSLGPHHVLLDCLHGPTRQAQEHSLLDLASVLKIVVFELHLAIARSATGAHRPANPADIALARTEAATVYDEFRTASAEDRRFILFRLLLVMPWTETQANPSSPLARRLGRLFDASTVAVRLLRDLANTWTFRAWLAGKSIVAAWSRGVQEMWTAAGGSNDEGAAFLQEPFPHSLPLTFAAFVRREAEVAVARNPPRRVKQTDLDKMSDIDSD
jgi:hypothetical protein